MSELFLVRHAQASLGEANYDRLSELGHRQAEWLGEYFCARNIQFDQIVTGTMTRHRETLAGINKGMQRAANGADEQAAWNEFDFQVLTELYLSQHPYERPANEPSWRELTRILKNALLAWAEDTIDRNGTDMESWADFGARVRQALEDIQSGGSGRRVLVVGSGGSISAAVQHILDLPAASTVQLNLQTCNTGMHRCVFNGQSISLSSFNNTPHLDSNERRQDVTYA